jgi:hypothetical protein
VCSLSVRGQERRGSEEAAHPVLDVLSTTGEESQWHSRIKERDGAERVRPDKEVQGTENEACTSFSIVKSEPRLISRETNSTMPVCRERCRGVFPSFGTSERKITLPID